MTEQRVGDYLVICDRSGFKCWASDTVIESHTGLRVHRRFADPEHPQDRRRAITDDTSVPDARPEDEDVFLAPGDVGPGDL